MSNDFTKINLRISREMYNWMKSESNRTGVSMTSYIIMALEAYRRQNEAMDTVESFYKHLQAATEQKGREQ